MATKDVGLRIRVERDLRDEFLEVCRAQDRPAAQLLRKFMRDYIADQKASLPKATAGKRRKRGGRAGALS